MPIITIIDGITIRMNPTLKEHNPPHVHAEYGGDTCTIGIQNAELIDGNIASTELKKAQEFVRNHSQELTDMWNNMDYRRIDAEDEKCTNTESAK